MPRRKLFSALARWKRAYLPNACSPLVGVTRTSAASPSRRQEIKLCSGGWTTRVCAFAKQADAVMSQTTIPIIALANASRRPCANDWRHWEMGDSGGTFLARTNLGFPFWKPPLLVPKLGPRRGVRLRKFGMQQIVSLLGYSPRSRVGTSIAGRANRQGQRFRHPRIV